MSMHPVHRLLRDAAAGALPTTEEIDALRLPSSARQELSREIVTIAALKDEGANGQARKVADEAAADIVTALPAEMQELAFYAPPDPHADVTDPKALAALVPRGW